VRRDGSGGDVGQEVWRTVERLYRDPTGTHGGLTRNQDAISAMFTYFEGLR